MSLVMSMVGGMVRQVNVTKVLDITGLAAGLEVRVEITGDEVEREGVRVNHTSTTKGPTHQLPSIGVAEEGAGGTEDSGTLLTQGMVVGTTSITSMTDKVTDLVR